MAVCPCSTGLWQLLPNTGPVSGSLSPQLRPERGVQRREMSLFVAGPQGACYVGWGETEGTHSQCMSADKSGVSTSQIVPRRSFNFKREIGGVCQLRKTCRSVGSLDRKPAVEVQARVQDAMVQETYVVEKGFDNRGKGCRDRNLRQTNSGGGRIRRVQVARNNGVVDLEEQRGQTKPTKGGSSRLRLSNQRNGSKVQRDEEGRLYFEYEFSGTDSDESEELDGNALYTAEELQTRQAGDAPSLAEAGSLVEMGSSSAPGRERGQTPAETPICVADVEVDGSLSAEQSFTGEVDVEEGWIGVGGQKPNSLVELPGGQRVVQLMGAWDGLAGRLPVDFARSTGSQLLLTALKLTVSGLQHAAPSEDGRTALSVALSTAYILADLRMDAEVIAAGLLREVVEAGYVRIGAVEQSLGERVAQLLHDCFRVKHMPSRVDTLDEDSAKAIRQFCLAFHDVRAVVVELAVRLDTMRHTQTLPRYRQQILALETMQIYAPLAHAIGTGTMSLELEDLGFWVLFPDSYTHIESWLKRHWANGDSLVNECRGRLLVALEEDPALQELLDSVTISGRFKSRYSIMKKLLRDGRQPEEVYDVLGLRVILTPKSGGSAIDEKERGQRACYRAMVVATILWKELPGRLKDYIVRPKQNGYESLHLAVCLDDRGNWSPPMEIQIRTAAMDAMAEGGVASHSLYKGGLTEPEQIGYLKDFMIAAADVAASRFSDLAGNTVEVLEGKNSLVNNSDQIFSLFDRNQDGLISMDEFKEVMGELGADGDDAHELMQLVDSNTDGTVSIEEFEEFRRQVKLFENLAGVDKQFTTQLDQKLLAGSVESKEGVRGVVHVTSKDVQAEQMEAIEISSKNRKEGVKAPIGEPANAVDFSSDSTVENLEEVQLQVHESPSEKMEQGRWMDRIEGSSKGSTSTSSSQNHVDNPQTRSTASGKQSDYSSNRNLSLAKPAKPARRTVETENLSDLKENRDFKSSPRPSTVVRSPDSWDVKNKGKDTSLLTEVKEAGVSGTIDDELGEIRRQIDLDNLASARSLLQKLSRKHPDDANILVHFAHLERKGGDSVAAGAFYSKAIQAFKEQGDRGFAYVRALQAWGSLEAQARNTTWARFLFIESIRAARKGETQGQNELKGGGVFGLHAWAMLEQKLGNWGKARILLERAESLQPGNAVVLQTRALLEAQAHNYAAARYYFRLAVEVAPDDVKCWQAWALFEASQGKPGKMRQYFKKALELEPEDMHSLQAWAHQEALIGSDASRVRARKLYQRCVEVNPESVHSWQAWAILEEKAGNFPGARILFERGIGANPSNVPCLQAYAHMERVCGNLEAARKLLRAALTVEPENAPSLMESALVEQGLGDEEAAADLFKQAGIADKRKSRVKRQMFESRKRTPHWKKPQSNQSAKKGGTSSSRNFKKDAPAEKQVLEGYVTARLPNSDVGLSQSSES